MKSAGDEGAAWSGSRAGSTRRERVEEREAAIIGAARALFLQQGVDKTTMRAVAERAGIAEGTVYLYFKHKKALLDAVLREFYVDLIEGAERGVREVAFTKGRLRFLAQHHLGSVLGEWQMILAAASPERIGARYKDTEVYRLNRRYVSVFDKVVKEGVDCGEIRADVSHSIVRDLFFGGLEYMVRSLVIAHKEEALDDLVDGLLLLVLDGAAMHDRPDPSNEAPVERLVAVAGRLERAVACLESKDERSP